MDLLDQMLARFAVEADDRLVAAAAAAVEAGTHRWVIDPMPGVGIDAVWGLIRLDSPRGHEVADLLVYIYPNRPDGTEGPLDFEHDDVLGR